MLLMFIRHLFWHLLKILHDLREDALYATLVADWGFRAVCVAYSGL